MKRKKSKKPTPKRRVFAPMEPTRAALPAPTPQRVTAHAVMAGGIFDAAAHIHHLAEYWAAASDKYTAELASAHERATMRGRCVQALSNEGYLDNAVRAFGNHCIGRGGPKLTLRKESGLTAEERNAVEWAFYHWQKVTGDVRKIRLAVRALMYAGESFERFIYDPYTPDSWLNTQEIEARRIDYPFAVSDPDMIDGIRFDGVHPVEYFIEKTEINPIYSGRLEYENVPAAHVMHTFLHKFPDQRRGIPLMASILRLAAETMIWESHTLAAAEWAARWGGFIRTNATFDSTQIMQVDGSAMIAPNPGEAVFAPEGWAPEQVKPEFPTGNFEGFSNALNREKGAGIGVPFGVMGADTSAYNYSSWRGERQNYWTFVSEVQDEIRESRLDPVFYRWIECHASFWRESKSAEICLQLLESFGQPYRIPVEWIFPEPPSADPEKDARADQINLEIGATSLHKIIESKGLDYEEVFQERLEEAKDAAKLKAAGEGINRLSEIQADEIELRLGVTSRSEICRARSRSYEQIARELKEEEAAAMGSFIDEVQAAIIGKGNEPEQEGQE